MHRVRTGGEADAEYHATTYGGRYFAHEVPKFRIPEIGMPSAAAYQLVHDELNLDGNPALNLASFVTAWMEPDAERLAVENLNKNLIDQDEYPQTEVIHERVVSMLGRLFSAPQTCTPVGTATVGSSEAIMLGLLAHKRAWQTRQEASGLPTTRPNVVFGADVHTCWEKFTRYFDVEARVVPMHHDEYVTSIDGVRERIDENTIAVGAVVGTTFTGQMDDVAGLAELVESIEAKKGWHVPLHVDGASGGFILPFVAPDVAWDFRLPQVRSINVSNHKFGLVYPGMGTVVFRDTEDLPGDLVFHITYLGGDMPNYSLNFSRSSTSVVLQYYNLLRLGRDGYTRIMRTMLDNAKALRRGLLETGHFEGIGDGELFPIVTVRARDPKRLDLFTLSRRVREYGWIVPAYPLPPDAEDVVVLRMVVKENMSRDMVDTLIANLSASAREIAGAPPPASATRHGMRRADPRPVC